MKETRKIEPFDTVNFKDFGTLILLQGEEVGLTIEADEDLLPELMSDVERGRLTLGLKGDFFDRFGRVISNWFSRKDRHVVYTLTCVDLGKINISGQCKLDCAHLNSQDLHINVSGMGQLMFGDLQCKKLQVKISGRGVFTASGSADDQVIKISGSGDYNASALKSKSTRIVISGHGDVTVNAAEVLDMTISGMGKVNYYGRPKIRQIVSGVGKAKRLSAS